MDCWISRSLSSRRPSLSRSSSPSSILTPGPNDGPQLHPLLDEGPQGPMKLPVLPHVGLEDGNGVLRQIILVGPPAPSGGFRGFFSSFFCRVFILLWRKPR